MRRQLLASVLAATLVIAVTGCSALSGEGAKKEPPAQVVSLSDVPVPARATIERLTAGGHIKKIERTEEHGAVVYDVEATVGAKEVEYDVAGDGKVLTSEETVAFASLPAAVKTAVSRYFGSVGGLKASREIEAGKTFYEVEGKKGGHAITLKLTDTGRILEEEK